MFHGFSKNGATLKGKNLLPLGENSFFLEKIPFQRFVVKKSNKEDTEVVTC